MGTEMKTETKPLDRDAVIDAILAETEMKQVGSQQQSPPISHAKEPEHSKTKAVPSARKAASAGEAAAKSPRRSHIFGIGMVIYVVVFLLMTTFLVYQLHQWLGEYESSQPQHTMDSYVANLDSGFYMNLVREYVAQVPVSEYETADSIVESLDLAGTDAGEYTWSKNAVEFTDEKPVYYIHSGNAVIASVALQRVGGTEHFNLPVWQAGAVKSLIRIATEPQYSLEVTVPDGASVLVNGVAIPMTDMQTNDMDIVLDDVAKQYAQQPHLLHAALDGLYAVPKVAVYDADGDLLTPIQAPKGTEAQQVYQFEMQAEAEPDGAFVSRVEAMMRAYIDYVVDENGATWTNLHTLDNYLLRKGSAYQKLHRMAGDLAWNTPYTSRLDRALEVSNVRMYSETLCTVDVHYEYQLTKTVVNDYVGDIRWTFVKTDSGWYASAFAILSVNS